MQHQMTRTAFGEVLGHPTKPQIRFFFPPDDGGAGGGSGGGGDGGDAAAVAAAAAAAAAAAGAGEEPLSAADAKALRQVSDKTMRERNAARDEAKAFKDLGLTVEEIADLKAKRDAANGGPTPEQIQKDADKRADTAAAEKFAAKARQSSVREQATVLGFHDPAVALALLNPAELAKVTVNDDLEPDAAAVKGLLTKLSTAQPYLLKTPGQQTVDYRTAGIGGAGGGAKPDPGPGTPRMAAAYATPAGQ